MKELTYKKITIFALSWIVMVLLISGCGKSPAEIYKDDYNKIEPVGISFCKVRGLDFINVYLNDLGEWTVACLKRSPIEVKRYPIEK